ncbi:hypothetical protein JOQ06_003743, partial [Pogonophryne albipinna]
MATLDRQIPSPDSFLCEPWSSFVTAAKLRFVDNSSSDDKQIFCQGKAVRLSKEDKMDKKLSDWWMTALPPQPLPNSLTPLVPMKPKAPAVTPTVVPSPGGTLAFRVPKEYPHSRFSKAPLAVYPPKGARKNKTCVSLPVVSLEKIPCLSRGDPSSHRSSEKLTNGRGPPTPRSTPSPSSSADRRPSPARSPLDRRLPSTPSPSPLERKPPPSPAPSQRSAALPVTSLLEKKQQNGTKTPSRSQKRLSGRVFDPNKHCGVQDPETKRPCTRSLTCKTHSLTHRRAVSGRGKHFDVLLAEHKGRETASPSRPHCTNGRTLSMLKLRLANAHIPSDEGDAETPEDGDRSASHSSHRHPQPLR